MVTVSWSSEDELLNEMLIWVPLADDNDASWEESEPPGPMWQAAERLLRAFEICGARGWRRAAIRGYDFLPDWDMHGMALSVRHYIERAYGVRDPASDLRGLTVALEARARHPRDGTRLWAAAELGVLRELSSLQVLIDLTNDPHPRVREQARDSIAMLSQRHLEAEFACVELGIAEWD